MSRRRYCDAATRGIGPTSATLVPPADDPPAGPSVKSQTLPADSATNDQGPAAACACGSAAKFSMRQKSGSAGNSSTFFSASGFATRDCWAIAVECDDHNPDAKTTIRSMRTRFIRTPPSFTIRPIPKEVYPVSKCHQRVSEIATFLFSRHPDEPLAMPVNERTRNACASRDFTVGEAWRCLEQGSCGCALLAPRLHWRALRCWGVIRVRVKGRFYAIGGNGGPALVAVAAHCA